MGKKSKAKQRRRQGRPHPVSGLIHGYAPRSLLATIEAAGASPTAAHRNLSLAALFHAVVQRQGSNGSAGPAKQAGAADLGRLIEGIGDVVPGIRSSEDFAPFDNRPEVLVRWGPALFRLLAGGLERPVAIVNEHFLLAQVIDRVLVPRLGFGLADVGELVLRRVDQVAGALVGQWPDGPVAEIGDEPIISQREVDAAAALPPYADLPQECSSPERAAAAAARYTVAARDLNYDPFDAIATFGTALAVRVRGTTVPLPAAMQIEALPAIGMELASIAAASHPRVDAAFAQVIARRIAGLLQGAGHSIVGPVRTASGREIHSLVIYHKRQILALDVAAGLTPSTIQTRLAEGGASLEDVRPGAELHTPDRTIRLPADARIVRAQVVAGPHLGVPLMPRQPLLPIADLEWILRSSQGSQDDLWYFVRDLTRPAGVRDAFAWDLIDKFEVWRPQKSFYRGGTPLTMMTFAPHASIAEWEAAAAAAPVERALHGLGLRPIRDWPLVEFDHRGGTEVGDLQIDPVYQVMSWPVPVAIATTDPTGPGGHLSLLWNLATCLTWKLDHIKEVFTAAAAASGLTSLRIVFAHHDTETGPSLTVANVGDGVLTIGWNMRAQDALAEDSFAVERILGEVVSQCAVAEVREEFISAWTAAPPGIRIDAVHVRQRAQWLPDPLEPHDAVRSDILRRLGEHMASTDIESGTREGQAATRFESGTVFPWLLKAFHENVSGLSGDELLTFALAQLERVHRAQLTFERKIGWQRGFPARGQGDGSKKREHLTRMVRVISFIEPFSSWSGCVGRQGFSLITA